MAKGKIDYDTVVAATSGDAFAAGRCSITSTTSWTDAAPLPTPTRMVLGLGIDLSMKSFYAGEVLARLWLSRKRRHLCRKQNQK